MRSSTIAKYITILIDWLAAIIAWTSFFAFRKIIEIGEVSQKALLDDGRFWEGIVIIPLGWLVVFTLVGGYVLVLHKTVARALEETLYTVLIGSLSLLFFVLVDDVTLQVKGYVWSFIRLLSIHLIVFVIFRLLSFGLMWVFRKRGVLSLRVIDARSLNVTSAYSSQADIIRIARDVNLSERGKLSNLLGTTSAEYVEVHESQIESLEPTWIARPLMGSEYVRIKVYPLVMGFTAIKRAGDILGSIIAMVVLTPVVIIIGALVKVSSPGPILYRQERIGQRGKSFEIWKFRTMYENAENLGPALATPDDPRCTAFGRRLRRWRLDEIPQFYNVLTGDMSIVGPRPERPFYAEQLVNIQPEYPLLWRTKPGITSWGQIKYGYASTIEEMLHRFRFDLMYIEHMNPLLDARIIWYTLVVLIQGKGR